MDQTKGQRQTGSSAPTAAGRERKCRVPYPPLAPDVEEPTPGLVVELDPEPGAAGSAVLGL
jgi:hypothetical protein